MLRVKMLPNGLVAFIEDRNVFVFNARNECVEETIITPKYTNGMQKLPIISVLSSNDSCDVAIFHDDIIEHIENPKSAMECVQELFKDSSYIRIVQREGKWEKNRYNQMIFIFPQGFNFRHSMHLLTK